MSPVSHQKQQKRVEAVRIGKYLSEANANMHMQKGESLYGLSAVSSTLILILIQAVLLVQVTREMFGGEVDFRLFPSLLQPRKSALNCSRSSSEAEAVSNSPPDFPAHFCYIHGRIRLQIEAPDLADLSGYRLCAERNYRLKQLIHFAYQQQNFILLTRCQKGQKLSELRTVLQNSSQRGWRRRKAWRRQNHTHRNRNSLSRTPSSTITIAKDSFHTTLSLTHSSLIAITPIVILRLLLLLFSIL